MNNSISVGTVKKSTGGIFQNSIIEYSGFNLAGNVLTLNALSRWSIGGLEYSNPNDVVITITPSTPLARQDRVLLNKYGGMEIQTGIGAFSGGTSYLRPYDENEFVQISILTHDGTGGVTSTVPVSGTELSLKEDIANKVSVLTPDPTGKKYPNVTAVIAGIQSPILSKYFNISGQPYTNTAEVLSQRLITARYIGLTVNVQGVEYTFKNGILDTDLVIKNNIDNQAELVVSTGGSINNQQTPTRFIRFTDQTMPTILSGLANPTDGKVVYVYNDTIGNLSILHNASSSLANNRFFHINNQDLFIIKKGTAVYQYSTNLQRWVLINLYGTDYFASLIGVGKRAMSVTALGMAVADPIMDFKIYDLARTTVYTKSSLNTAYPLLTKGQQVVCPNITVGGVTYEKYDDTGNDWLVISTPKLT